jgi:hypothetical protein
MLQIVLRILIWCLFSSFSLSLHCLLDIQRYLQLGVALLDSLTQALLDVLQVALHGPALFPE